MWNQFFQDALFSAIAAIGFAAISRPSRRTYIYCAMIAAVCHSGRFLLMNSPATHFHIVAATLVASLVAGLLAVFLSPVSKTPAEACLFPALLPMIPGIYAYKAFGGLAMCLIYGSEDSFGHYFYLFAQNALTTTGILLAMVVGATIPIFIFERVSFQATRNV